MYGRHGHAPIKLAGSPSGLARYAQSAHLLLFAAEAGGDLICYCYALHIAGSEDGDLDDDVDDDMVTMMVI